MLPVCATCLLILLACVGTGQAGAAGGALDDAQVANTYYKYSTPELEAVCAAMSPSSYASGLNDGAWMALPFTGRTYYYRSACYYELARRSLEPRFCNLVKERKTWLGDGSSVSPASCLRMLDAARAAGQAQQADANRHAAQVTGVFQLAEPDLLALPDGGWKLTVSTQGALAGSYRLDIELLTPRRTLVSQNLTLDAPVSRSWTLSRHDVVGSAPLPAIFPMAISLYYSVPPTATEPARMHLTSIRNLTLSAP